MKKWILKTEISQILNTYSVNKDEFETVKDEKFEHYYKNKFVKGYFIEICDEIEKSTRTGRIIVKHIKPNGKIKFFDIWERNKEGKIEFTFRNLSNQPISDADYIRDLNEEIKKMREQYHKLTNDTEYKELKHEKLKLEMDLDEKDNKYNELEKKYQKLIIEKKELETNLYEKFQNFHDLISENKNLKRENEKLQEENQKLISDTTHNSRGAGRKPSQERINAIEEVRKLLKVGTNEKEIMNKLDISKATFYRYKKEIN